MWKTILLATALVAVASSAQAQAGRTLRMARVAYGDLDLTSPRGARLMLHRLNAAAKSLCVNLHTPVLPGESGRTDQCRREAVASAVERLSRPQLTVAFAEVSTQP